jgi:hypothetical protein
MEKEPRFVVLPTEPTKEMLRCIAVWTFEDIEVGKRAQMAGADIPPNAEMEGAYGRYKRMIEPWIIKIKEKS